MEYKTIHKGQYKKYGDSYYIYAVKSENSSREEILRWCKENFVLHKNASEVPSVEHWWSNDMKLYFSGCYCLTENTLISGLDLLKEGYKYTFTYLVLYCD